MAPQLSLTSSFSFDGSAVYFVDEDTFIFSTGNAVKFMSTMGATQSFLQIQEKRGVSALASNPKAKLFAFSPRAIKPTVYVYNWPEKNLMFRLTDGAPLEYGALAFSREGERLVGIGASLELKLVVWDLNTGAKFSVAGGSTLLPAPCSFVSFDPCNVNRLCAGGPSGLSFWTLVRSFDEYTLPRVPAKLVDEEAKNNVAATASSDIDDHGDSSRRVFVQCHTWGPDGHVYAANATGELLRINSQTGQVVKRFSIGKDPGVMVSALLYTRQHLVAACSDGAVRWLTHTTREVEQTVQLAPRQLCGSETPLRLSYIVPSPYYDKLLVASMQGTLHELPSEIDTTPGPDGEDPVVVLPTPTEFCDFHAGTVHGIAAIYSTEPNSTLFATASEDGTLRVWDYSLCQLVNKVSFGEGGAGASAAPRALTALTSSSASPFLAVGALTGVVRLLYVERASEGTVKTRVVRRVRAHTTPVTALTFNDGGDLLATVSAMDSAVCVFDTAVNRQGTAMRMVAYVDLTDEALGQDAANPTAITWRGDQLLLALGSAVVVVINTRELDSAKSAEKPLALPCNPILRLEAVTTAMVRDPITPTTLWVASSTEKELKQCEMPPASEIASASSAPSDEMAAMHDGYSLHEKGLLGIALHPSSAMLATASSSGAIAVWSLKSDGVKSRVESGKGGLIWAHDRPVTCMAWAANGQHIFSSGLDGSVVVSMVRGGGSNTRFAAPQTPGLQPAVAAVDPLHSAEPSPVDELTALEVWRKQALDEAAAAHDKAKSRRRGVVNSLRSRLEMLLQNNDRVPPLERMDRSEFTVDLEGRDQLLRENEMAAARLQSSIERENHGRELVANRIVKECWDSMAVKGTELHAFTTGATVRNFPLHHQPPAEQARFERVARLRKIELREIRAANGGSKHWPDALGALESGGSAVEWILNAGRLVPAIDAAIEMQRSKRNDKNGGAATGSSGGGDKAKGSANGEVSGADVGDDTNDKQEDDAEGGDFEGLLDLLYQPCTLRTTAQRRTQMILLKMLVRKMMTKFNEHFSAVYALKENEMDRISQKNERIAEILVELDSNSLPEEPKWSPGELPESIITVSDDEVKVERYISKAERERLAREEEERLRREAENAGDNLGARALQDMMNGALEVKRDLASLEQELIRDEWMDEIPVEEMNEEQVRLLEEFNMRQKAVQEEKEKHRKALELELKKLKTDVSDIMRVFDEKIEGLKSLKVRVLRNVSAQELFQMRLALALLAAEDSAVRESRLDTELSSLAKKKSEAHIRLTHFRSLAEDHREELQRMADDDKALDRGFRQSIQDSAGGTLDLDTLKILQQLFKQRAGRRRSSFASGSGARGSISLVRRTSIGRRKSRSFARSSTSIMSGGGGTSTIDVGGMGGMKSAMKEALKKAEQAVLDPYTGASSGSNADSKALEEQERREQLLPLNLETDCPEGFLVEENEWNRLQELRTQKILSELDLKKKSSEGQEMVAKLDELQAAFDDLVAKIDEVNQERIKVLHDRKQNSGNIEVLVHFKQGQDEVEQEAVVTDYENSVLLHRDVIERENVEIRKLGAAKVVTLNRMKEFRKDINFMLWEHKYLEQQVNDLEEHYTDLHMLRVTRGLQDFLKGADQADRQKEQAAQAEAKLEHMRRAHQNKISKMKKVLRKLQMNVAEKQGENDRLGAQVQELQANVSVREGIQRSRISQEPQSTEKVGDATRTRMKALVTRRKLIDLARAQTDEIEFLRQELDRLRQRTFPSFAHATRRALQGNPDESFGY